MGDYFNLPSRAYCSSSFSSSLLAHLQEGRTFTLVVLDDVHSVRIDYFAIYFSIYTLAKPRILPRRGPKIEHLPSKQQVSSFLG